MFVKVKYGDEKEQLCNTYCRNDIFLEFVKSQCQCQPEDVIDLADERGLIKHLRRFPQDYAKDFLKDRETLILLSIVTINQLSSQSEDSLESPPLKFNTTELEEMKQARSRSRNVYLTKRSSARRGARMVSRTN
ncbi:uncharacterized protein CXorf65 homolog isoform X4 [Biomphalaria glabrata]|uniref:Uncharacterized protein CXorf65 homolog isoform X4 n=1 Tax=Biomphalaria glabrata TaxID=6526 RepID=A0A9U8E2Q2_BIOGL|nr:uncharacterized protein CXorf65 homolog isoform X4 [Biomphalaria glabrata]